MLHLLALAALGGLFTLLLIMALMYLAGWRAGDARDVVLNRAFGSFTYEGELIPGATPSRGARAVIRLLSDEDDVRRELVGSAMGDPPRERSRSSWPR